MDRFLVMEAMCAVCMGEFWSEKGMWMVWTEVNEYVG